MGQQQNQLRYIHAMLGFRIGENVEGHVNFLITGGQILKMLRFIQQAI